MFLVKIPYISLLILVAICVVPVVGAFNSAENAPGTEAKKPVVALLIHVDIESSYIRGVTDAIVQNIGDEATVFVVSADNDQLIQNEQVDYFIDEKVNGLIVNLVDTSEAASISEKALKANLPVVFFSSEPDLEMLKKYKNTFFVGTMKEHAGILQGDIIAALWKENPSYDKNKDGIIQYIMVQASPDSAEAIARTEYSIKQATKNGLKLKQVGKTFMCGWRGHTAREAISQAWPLIGEQVELVIANNDAMALGAISVLQENGYNLGSQDKPYIPVVGVDALKQALNAIGKGIMAGTVKQDGHGMAQAIKEVMLNALNGKPFIQNIMPQWHYDNNAIRIPYSLITPDLIENAE